MRFYLQNAAPATSLSGAVQGTWDQTTGAIERKLGAMEKSGSRTSSAVSESVATNPWDMLGGTFVSDPVPYGGTVAGVLSGVLGMFVNTNGTSKPRITAYVVQGNTTTLRGMLVKDWQDTGAALSNSGAAVKVIPSITLSSVDVEAGDRIVIEIGYRQANVLTYACDASIYYGGTGERDWYSGITNAFYSVASPYLEMPDADVLYDAKRLYFTNSAAPATPASANTAGWNDYASRVDKYLSASKAGASLSVAKAEVVTTNPYYVGLLRLVSDPLLRDGLSPTKFTANIAFSSSNQFSGKFAETIAVYAIDSSGALRGSILLAKHPAEVDATTTLIHRLMANVSLGTQINLYTGDRLVVEIGYTSTNGVVTSYTGTTRVGGTATDAVNGASTTTSSPWIDFKDAAALFIAPPEAYTAAAGLSGGGALSAGIVILADSALSGDGQLAADVSAAAAYAAAAALSGSGALSTTTMQAIARAIALSGPGALSVVVKPAQVRLAALSGSGSLIVPSVQGLSALGALTGSGALTVVAGSPTQAQLAGLGGSGALAITAVQEYAASAILSGEGQLSALAVGDAVIIAALSGSGQLSAAVIPKVALAAALSGSGALAAAMKQGYAATVQLSGAGQLSTTAAQGHMASPGLSGGGALLAAVSAAVALIGALSGSGQLAASTAPSYAREAALSGSGQLAAAGAAQSFAGVVLSGSGQLSSAWAQGYWQSPLLSGSGQLAAEATVALAALAALSGGGQLAASTAASLAVTAALSGGGGLSALGLIGLTVTADLSGDGELSTLGLIGLSVTAALSGSGQLTILAIQLGIPESVLVDIRSVVDGLRVRQARQLVEVDHVASALRVLRPGRFRQERP